MEEVKMENPWLCEQLEEFLFFNCPECDEKSQSKEYFLEHALTIHPLARECLLKFQVKDEPPVDDNNDFDENDNEEEDESYYYEMEPNVSMSESFSALDNLEYDDYQEDDKSTIKQELEGNESNGMLEKPVVKKKKKPKKPSEPKEPKEPKEKRDSYQCGSCGQDFLKWADLENHYKTVHVHKDMSGQNKYNCAQCNEMFDTLSKLKYHAKNAHLNKKAHKCKYCDETFTRPLYLNKHVKTVHNSIHPIWIKENSTVPGLLE